MKLLKVLALTLALGMFLAGCGGHHSGGGGPYVNRFLSVEVDGHCVIVTVKTPVDYRGYLTFDDNDQAVVFVNLGEDERVDGWPVSVEEYIRCHLTPGEHTIRFEIVFEGQTGNFANMPFGYTFMEEVVVVIDEWEPEPEPCDPCGDLLIFGGETVINSDRLQKVIDLLHVRGTSRIDVQTDYLADDLDSYWGVMPCGESVATMIIELAGFRFTNILGIYDIADPENRVVLFDGPDHFGDAVTLVVDDGVVIVNGIEMGTFTTNQFGFFLDSSAQECGGLFFSDSGLNPNGADYMLAYQGDDNSIINLPDPFSAEVWNSHEWILAFEDLYDSGVVTPTCEPEPRPDPEPEECRSDFDFEDMVVLVSWIRPGICE